MENPKPDRYTVRDATKECFERYLLFRLDEGTLELCKTAIQKIETLPIDKLSRWLGYVQGVAIERGLSTVKNERDFSRPLFHKAYTFEGTEIPKSVDINE